MKILVLTEACLLTLQFLTILVKRLLTKARIQNMKRFYGLKAWLIMAVLGTIRYNQTLMEIKSTKILETSIML
jgi:hypothetical protein